MKIELDQGYQFGLGAFETIALEHGHPVFLERHLNRMEKAAEFLKLGSLKSRGITCEEVLDYLVNIAEEDTPPEIVEESEISIPTEEEVINKIVHLLDVNFADELKTHLSKIGILLSKEWPGFDARNYGYRNMRQLLNNHAGIVKIEDEKAPDGIHNITYIMKK